MPYNSKRSETRHSTKNEVSGTKHIITETTLPLNINCAMKDTDSNLVRDGMLKLQHTFLKSSSIDPAAQLTMSLFDDVLLHLSFSPLCWCEAPTWQCVQSSVHSTADCSCFFCTVPTHPWQKSIPYRGCAIPSHCSLTCFIFFLFSKKEYGIIFSTFSFCFVLAWFGFKSS